MRTNNNDEGRFRDKEGRVLMATDRLKEVRIVNHTGERTDQANRRSFAVRNTHFRIFVNVALFMLAFAVLVLAWDTKRQFDEKKEEQPAKSQNCLKEYEDNRCNDNTIQLLEVCSKLLECINQPDLKSEVSLSLLLADNMNRLLGGLTVKTLLLLSSLMVVTMISCALLSSPPNLETDFGTKLTN